MIVQLPSKSKEHSTLESLMNAAERSTPRPIDLACLAISFAAFSLTWPRAGSVDWIALAPAALLFAFASWPARDAGVRLACAVFGALVFASALPLPPIWPLHWIATATPLALALWLLPAIRPERFAWRGRLELPWAVATAILSGAALVLWVLLARPDLARFRASIPDVPVPLIVLGLVLFSTINAAVEEVIFRGLLQGAIKSASGSSIAAIALTSIVFGLAHWQGFPNGPIGAVMACVFAAALGWLREKSGGLLAPFVAHVAADAVIASIIFSRFVD
jgi:uncharacterized protein